MRQVFRLAICRFAIYALLTCTGLSLCFALNSSTTPLSQNLIVGSADFTTIDPRTDLFSALTDGNFLNEGNSQLRPSARERLEELRRLTEQQLQQGLLTTPTPGGVPAIPPGLSTLPTLPGAGPKPNLPSIPNRPTNPRDLEGFLGKSVAVARVSDEFKCDLFGNSPYSQIDTSLNALIEAMKIQPDCQDSVNRVEQIQKTNDQIKLEIAKLEQMLGDEGSTGLKNTPTIANAADSAQDIVQLIQTNYSRITQNPLLNPRCSAFTSSVPQMVKSVSDLASNSAPLIMIALSLAPSIGIQAKLIGIAGTMLATLASGAAESVIRSGVDITKESNRRAIVQNVCQFTKIYRQYKIIQMARSSDLSTIQIILNNQISANETDLEFTNPFLYRVLKRRGQFERNIGMALGALSRVGEQIDAIQAHERFKAIGNAPDRCGFFYEEIFGTETPNKVNVTLRAPNLLQNAMSILVGLETQPVLENAGSLTLATQLRQRHVQQLVRQLESKKQNLNVILSDAINSTALEPSESNSTNEISPQIFETCERQAQEIFNDSKKMANEAEAVLQDIYARLNRQMQSTEATRVWHEKFVDFRKDVLQIQGLWKLIRDVRENANPLISTEVSIKMDQVRLSLLGDFNTSGWNITSTSSATFKWLDFQMSSLEASLSSFQKLVWEIQREAVTVLRTKTGPSHNQYNKDLQAEFMELTKVHGPRVANLDILKDGVNFSPDFKRNLCRKMFASYIEFAKARDYFNSSRFMCSMINEEVTIAERPLQRLCQPTAVTTAAVRPAEPTGLNKLLQDLNEPQRNYGGLSTLQILTKIASLVQEYQCHSIIQIPDVTKSEMNDEISAM